MCELKTIILETLRLLERTLLKTCCRFLNELFLPSMQPLVSAHFHVNQLVETWNLLLISVSQHVLILSDWLSSALPQNRTVALSKIKADMMDYLSAAALCTLIFRKSSLIVKEDTLMEDSHPARKFLLCPHLLWSLCCCMLISFRVSVWFGRLTLLRLPEQAWTSRRMWTMSTLPDFRGWSQVRALNQHAEANRCCDFTAVKSCTSVSCSRTFSLWLEKQELAVRFLNVLSSILILIYFKAVKILYTLYCTPFL